MRQLTVSDGDQKQAAGNAATLSCGAHALRETQSDAAPAAINASQRFRMCVKLNSSELRMSKGMRRQLFPANHFAWT